MAGHMGMDQVTTRNHPLVKIDADNNLLLIKGALPGPNGGLLFVRKSDHGEGEGSEVAMSVVSRQLSRNGRLTTDD